MAEPNTEFTIKPELRLCTVNGESGYFHCWEHFCKPVYATLSSGQNISGVVSYVQGIVEFHDRVERVDPKSIKFCDEENAYLQALVKYEIDISKRNEGDHET